MKKSTVLSTPVKLEDLRLDEFYEDNDQTFETERINSKQLRQFKREAYN